jgi:murein DD-endopeptidase MepM/ murein hydrolase activator NlpD
MVRRTTLRWFAVAVLASSTGCVEKPEPPSPIRPDVHLVPDTETIAGSVPARATLDSLLQSCRLRGDLVAATVAIVRPVFDPRRLKAGHAFTLQRSLDGLLRTFEYEVDGDWFLRVVGRSNRQPEDITAELVPYRKEHALVSMRGRISESAPSLFQAMDEAGEGPDLSLELADIFGGEIDFHTELQPGDSFGLTFEKVYREGEAFGYGGVLGAEFSNDGRVLQAIRFTVAGGKPAYYDAQGRSLRRFFLKSPLKFEAAVSSRFSGARMHPVLRIVRPHLGVDYRAYAGAPVVAVANGTVVSAGWNGEAGLLVHLRHASGYETLYMHLSAIAKGIRPGAHVGQGDPIGKVGMTGLATGPHLDYRVRLNGKYLNPLIVHRSLPPGDPIPASELAAFQAERDRVLSMLAKPAGEARAGGAR